MTGCVIQSRHGWLLQVKCRAYQGEISVENVTRDLEKQDVTPAEKQERLRRYVELLSSPDRTPPSSRSRLRPKLETREIVSGWTREGRAVAVPTIELAGGLVIVLAFDVSANISIARQDDLRSLKLNPSQALAIAVSNLERLPMKPLSLMQEDPRAPAVYTVDTDNYGAWSACARTTLMRSNSYALWQ